MAFTLQTDAGDVVDANAYIDWTFFSAYHNDRGADISSFDETTGKTAIVAATDYIDQRWRLKGRRLLGPDQATEFPREFLYDNEGYLVEGLPRKIKQACAEYALEALKAAANALTLQPTPTVDESGRAVVSKTENVGPIQTSYTYSSSELVQLIRPYPAADRLMRDFILTGGGVTR